MPASPLSGRAGAAFDAAMRRQFARFHAVLAAGVPRVGWKICVNEPRTQARLGLAAPFVGALNGARVVASPARYAVRPESVLACEPEIAIRIGATRDLGAAIAALAPALEVVDYARASPALEVVVESASFHDGAVLGDPRPPAAAPVLGAECPRVTRNGAPAGTPDPTLVPADLGCIVQHVAAFLARYDEALREGDWILSGACVAPVRVVAGDEVRADFGPLGVVAVTFVDAGVAPGFALPGGGL